MSKVVFQKPLLDTLTGGLNIAILWYSEKLKWKKITDFSATMGPYLTLYGEEASVKCFFIHNRMY